MISTFIPNFSSKSLLTSMAAFCSTGSNKTTVNFSGFGAVGTLLKSGSAAKIKVDPRKKVIKVPIKINQKENLKSVSLFVKSKTKGAKGEIM